MYGIIHSELKGYVTTRYDAATWGAVLVAAGLPGRQYMAGQPYPDSEILAIVTTASAMTSVPVPVLLEDFGAYIVPKLVSVYRPFIKDSWRTLDFIENTENSIHKAVRIRDKGAQPPRLAVSRISPIEVLLTYTSKRKMCAVAKGIARGVAQHYGETIEIEETACMHRNDEACLISIKLLTERTAAPRPPAAVSVSTS